MSLVSGVTCIADPLSSEWSITLHEVADGSILEPRETSHKALSAVNQMSLIPFLMPFLASPDRVPLGTVTAAGGFWNFYRQMSTDTVIPSAMPVCPHR